MKLISNIKFLKETKVIAYYEKFGKKLDIRSIVKNRFYETSIDLIDRLNKNRLDGNDIVSI